MYGALAILYQPHLSTERAVRWRVGVGPGREEEVGERWQMGTWLLRETLDICQLSPCHAPSKPTRIAFSYLYLLGVNKQSPYQSS